MRFGVMKKHAIITILLFIGSFCMASKLDFSVYKARRAEFIKKVQERAVHQSVVCGAIILCADFEGDAVFTQESSFYYFTGIKEPGAVCILSRDGSQQLYVPNCVEEREKWLNSTIKLTQSNAELLGFDVITELGEKCLRYQIFPFSPEKEYATIVERIKNLMQSDAKLFSTWPSEPYGYLHQRLLLSRLIKWCSGLENYLLDCSDVIAQMRRTKSKFEIENIFRAIQVTVDAQAAAAQAIGDGVCEAEVQASLEYVMTANNTFTAFSSIVGSGPNSTVLHYGQNDRTMKNGDLVVVDIGASYKHYAADITRTYPVSGTFTDRQKEIYAIVLEAQEYAASIAQPGYYLRSNDHQEKSLHHLVIAFLKKRGYDKYMPHGLGHYLGLDVHDVGDYSTPLQPGDVFTIEPGIYISAEELGIRIEDDYWMTEEGVICLSEDIPKSIEDIERMVQKKFE